jgi:hypothetical protein
MAQEEQQGQQQEQGQQQQEQQQEPSPAQQLANALSNIRKVQNLIEMNYPQQGEAIKLQREAGDLVWSQVQKMQQQQQSS